ncbi:hypothetical protein KJ632_05520 [Patescibacteria group bacterium]|nr:hypothetical protein [Patescibacteria group bacterium]
MEVIKQFLSKLIDSTPGSDFSYYIPLSILATILIIGGLGFSYFYNHKKKTDFAFKRLFKNLSKNAYIFGGFFIVLALIRYENIPYFAMRLWLYTVFAIFIYQVYRYIKIFRTKYPKEKENAKLRFTPKQQENKYLPNKKKRK